MNKKLERIAEAENKLKAQKQKLKAQKRKELAKEYEKIGREFYKNAGTKSVDMAKEMITKLINLQTQEKRLINLKAQLQTIANSMEWNGNYWHVENLKEITDWLSQFRKENEQ